MEQQNKPTKKHIGWIIGGVVALLLAGATTFLTLTLLHQPKQDDKPTAGVVQPPEPAPQPSRAEQILAGMTLDEKIGQMFVVDTANLEYGTRGGNTNINATDNSVVLSQNQTVNLVKFQPGGVVFFGGNIASKQQIQQYINDLQANSPRGLIIATDQEGGIVDRLSVAGITRYPNMADIGATGDPNQAGVVGTVYGQEMKVLGFNVNFAPVADVNTNPNNPVIGVRAFDSNPNLVASMVAAEVQGLQANGVGATLKHFPGHGDTATDTHTGMAVVESDAERLHSVELVPFKAGIEVGADLVLTAHIKLPNIDPSGLPATMSKIIITDLLRGELGFDGVVITDALDMAAISNYYSSAEVVANCVNAGVDILLMPKNYFEAHEAFLGLVQGGSISEERVNQSVLRILDLKLKLGIIE